MLGKSACFFFLLPYYGSHIYSYDLLRPRNFIDNAAKLKTRNVLLFPLLSIIFRYDFLLKIFKNLAYSKFNFKLCYTI